MFTQTLGFVLLNYITPWTQAETCLRRERDDREELYSAEVYRRTSEAARWQSHIPHAFTHWTVTLTFSLVDHYTTFASVTITLLNSWGELTTVKEGAAVFLTLTQNTVGAKSLETLMKILIYWFICIDVILRYTTNKNRIHY